MILKIYLPYLNYDESFGNLLFKIYNIIFSYLDSIKLKNKSYQYYNRGFKIFKIKNNLNFSNKNKG